MGGGDTAEEHVTWMLWAPTHPPTDKMASPFLVSLRFAILSFFIWEVKCFFFQLILVFLWSLLMAAMVWAPTTTTRQDGLPPTSLEIKIPHDFNIAKHRH